ncbi:dTMP kinase [Candidatus Cyanaurora vandensis]|uniref:dTMP kinase n=1 Tax=Candidatus Cyanaurora vandensis TaxID=2714958 RepID=UPI00257E3DB9|nr:dTMP kinase [Candidatus Cyanaurora vandensis]
MFITFEGGEGAGKSTQVRLVQPWLTKLGYVVCQTHEPGGTALGQQVRAWLLDPAQTITPTAELLLFAADRAQHVTEVLRPALQQGQLILCDRYTDSTLAYQGWGRGLDLAMLHQLNTLATQGLKPHLTLWLDVPPKVGRARVRKERAPDRLEAETSAFHERVYQGFCHLHQAEPTRVIRINGTPRPTEVFAAIQSELAPRLPSCDR